MKVLINGSTGLIGSSLITAFKAGGFEVIPVGRADFDADTGLLAAKMNDVDVVINLAGAPLIARWSASYKREILESRRNVTRKMVQAIALTTKRPRLFISASAVGIYPGNEIYTESYFGQAHDFLSGVCREWEAEARLAESYTSVAIFRFGVVLSKKGGALSKMLLPFKLGLGGPIAGGKQGFSWIHMDDLINAYLYVIENQLDGVFNLSAPEITDNAGFTRALGKAVKRPAILPVPAFALRLVYGEGASALTNGQKVIPERLQKEGFVFRFPELETALMDLLK